MKTKAEYAAYEQSVADFHNQLGLSDHNGPADLEAEAFFSWRPCPCCGSALGGNRHLYRFLNRRGNGSVSAAICDDCVYYLTYGRLDDTTMMEVENSSI